MIALLGWVLFAVTIVVAVWRDVRLQGEAEKRYDDDMRFWEAKREEWITETRRLRSLLSDVRKAVRDI